jgi:Tfp pilus assembly protein PilV
MKHTSGLTVAEVIVAMALLAIVGVAMLSMLPMMTNNTQASTVDTIQSQRVIAVFEDIALAWSNPGAWNNNTVASGQSVDALVQARLGDECQVNITTPSPERKRVVITCEGGENLPVRRFRAEFGDPNA